MSEALPGTGQRQLHFIDFGWFRSTGGRRQLLTWHSTGDLLLGDVVVAHITSEIEVRRRLAGWAEHCDTREGLGWLAQQLEGCR